MPPRLNTVRVEFSRDHDKYLVKYLARYCPFKEGRSGQKVYQLLVANEQKRWPWSVHHTWQSWRERYVKHSGQFDALILNYQEKHNIKPTEKRKRAAEPIPIEMLRSSAKRVKLEVEAEVPSSETRTEQAMGVQHASSSPQKSKPTSKSVSKSPRKPQDAPSQVHPPREPEPTDDRPSSPPRSSINTNIDVTEKPALDLPVLQTRHDTLEIPPSSPDKPAKPPTEDKPENRSPPRAMKRMKKRSRAPSEVFASEPSSPSRDPHVADAGGVPVTDTVYPRAPPRVVNSLQGQVLVDQKGHVPLAFPHGEEDEAQEEEAKVQWPPLRGRTAKQKRPDVEIDAHHAFSQLQPRPQPEVPRESVKTDKGKPQHPFGHVSRVPDGAFPDRRSVAAQFSREVRQGVAPPVESERREDVIRNGASPVKRMVPTVPPSDPLSGRGPKPSSKVLKFPAPRASTQSPFRPEPPAEETRHFPPRPQPRTKAARHPALTRVRRQTIGHGHGNGDEHEHEHRQERERVPSVDLVALSHSSMSARSHSRSSAGGPAPVRPSRWSLPAFAHATPWVFDEPRVALSASGSASGSGSGSPFRWVAPAPVYGDIWGHRHGRTSSLEGTSTPRITFTPSPARSITAVATNTNATAPYNNAASPSLSLTPHPSDIPLAASHGLASILAHMSANHGLALGVVEAVYTRVGNLREADEVLRGMREAAEGFGGREIERIMKGRREERRRSGVGREGRGKKRQGSGEGEERGRAQIRYVVASEDGEGSEYSPPETSRAAIWKQQTDYVEEGGEEEGEGKNGEGDRDDEVEVEELCEGGGENNEVGLPDVQHISSDEGGDKVGDEEQTVTKEVLLENLKARALERKVGRGQYRRDIVRRFV